ncbi:DNA cytosine methyltransferase [Streptomyces sp. NPDC126499]|uniref:DNA cytosine methyltransferase n=1 Tax=Streptomyces sp. NPDC126499 TaxID=3155314 RepID=UPI003329D36F
MSGLRIGSVCTGYGGLDMAVQAAMGGAPAWVADNDSGAARILAHHHPQVPNLGDITAVDWHAVEPVDVIVGGYPCQPFSTAGKRKGTADERHIWPYIANALRVLRPRIAVFENVANHLRLGFADVLADLARLGFDAQWCLVRASEVGAPHQRQRLFVLAVAADPDGLGGDGRRARGAGRDEPPPHRHAPPDTSGEGLEVRRVEPHWNERQAAERGRGEPPTDTDASGRRADEPDVRPGQPDADWGRFAPAITRWEAVTGRRAPWATDDRRRLNPAFVEWLMGLEAGHVTTVPGLTRTQQLKALGNGVVPQQAEAAIRLLLAQSATGPVASMTSPRRTHGIAA